MNKSIENLKFSVYTKDIVKSVNNGRRLIRGYASVSDIIDRQNEVVTHDALVMAANDLLENHRVFYEHKHDELPIGKVVSSTVDNNGLVVVVELSKGSHAENIWTLIKEGILNSFSIGGRIIDAHSSRDGDGNSYNVIDKLELFEVSVVGLPANAEARFKLVKSFNMTITEQIKEKEGRIQMAEQELKEKLEDSLNEAEELNKEENTESSVKKSDDVVDEAEVLDEESEDISDSSLEKKEGITDDVLDEVVNDDSNENNADECNENDSANEVDKSQEDASLKDEDSEKAEWSTAYINALPNSSFAVIEPAYLEGITEDKRARHLPFKDDNGEVDLSHYRNALARVNQIKPITDSISMEELRSKASAELEKYRDVLESDKSMDEKILDALNVILEKLASLDKSEDVVEETEVISDNDEGSSSISGSIEASIDNDVDKSDNEDTIEDEQELSIDKNIDKEEEKEEVSRKSMAIVVPNPYDTEDTNNNNIDSERQKNMDWSKLIYGK